MNCFSVLIRFALLSALAAWPTSGDTEHFDRQTMLYVSARYGDDGWSGRLPEPNAEHTDGPLASFDGARRRVRAMDKTGLSRITVLFRNEADHAQTASFEAADAVRPIVAAYPDASAAAATPGDLLAPVSFAPPARGRDGVYRLSEPVLLGPQDSGSQITEIV